MKFHNRNVLLNYYFAIKKVWKIWMVLDIENLLWKSGFDSSALCLFTKYNNVILLMCLFLAKKPYLIFHPALGYLTTHITILLGFLITCTCGQDVSPSKVWMSSSISFLVIFPSPSCNVKKRKADVKKIVRNFFWLCAKTGFYILES